MKIIIAILLVSMNVSFARDLGCSGAVVSSGEEWEFNYVVSEDESVTSTFFNTAWNKTLTYSGHLAHPRYLKVADGYVYEYLLELLAYALQRKGDTRETKDIIELL